MTSVLLKKFESCFYFLIGGPLLSSFSSFFPKVRAYGGLPSSRRGFPVSTSVACRAFAPTGLTRSPQAEATSPAAKMLCAALISRSCHVPQQGHTHSRTSNVSVSRTCPQSEHVFEEGYQRAILMIVRPYHVALYSSWRVNSPQPTSLMALAKQWFFSIPLTFKVSKQITWFS